MTKKILFCVLEFLLFLILFAVGSFLNPFHLHWGTTTANHVTRYFVPDGLLLALGVFIAIAAVQAIRKRRCDTPWTVIAFLAAVAVSYALKFGFATHDLYN